MTTNADIMAAIPGYERKTNAEREGALMAEVRRLSGKLEAEKHRSWILEGWIADAHFRAFGERHYEYTGAQAACDLLVADIGATQVERDALKARAETAEAKLAAYKSALETLNHAAKVAISTEYGSSFDEDTPLTIRLLDGTCDATDAILAGNPPPEADHA